MVFSQVSQRRWLVGALAAAFCHGLLYLVITPPWQHYDEPNHFEYVWLLAERDVWWQVGQPDPAMRREIAQSAAREGLVFTNDFSQEELINIGVSQLDDPPVYYLIASLPLRVLHLDSAVANLFAARAVSLLLLLLSVWAVWGTAAAIFTEYHIVTRLLPLSLALLPSFVELMTAVNSDVGAVAVFAFFLWVSVRTIKDGMNLKRVFGVLGTAILAAWTKSTIFLALPLAGFVLLWGVLGRRREKIFWLFLGSSVLGGLLLGIYLQEPAYWYRHSSQNDPVRRLDSRSPVGEFALWVDSTEPTTPSWLPPLLQPLPLNSVSELWGSTVTVGSWMWSDKSANTVLSPVLVTEAGSYSVQVAIDEQPQFVAFQVDVPPQAGRMWIYLNPASSLDEGVYYDGLVVAKGAYSVDSIPDWGQENDFLTWGGEEVKNLLRNGSSEAVWPAVVPSVDNLAAKALPNQMRITPVLYSVLDFAGASWYYRAAIINLFQTFWARFGWGNVRLVLPQVYVALGLLTSLGMGAAAIWVWNCRKILWKQRAVILFLSLVLTGVWGGALIRGAIFVGHPRAFIPSARYGYPAAGISMLILLIGWRQVGFWLSSIWKNLKKNLLIGAFLTGYILLDFLALASVVNFFYS